VKYLLDTCLISELVKPKPNAAVLRWLDGCDENSLFLSVLTFGELHKGISKLPDSLRKDELQGWVNNDLIGRFEGRIIGIDTEVATAWGILQGESERRGEKLPVMDSLIASTASVHNLIVVTRDTKDMERCSARIYNPWSE
jgi:toxin FitB